MIAVFGVGGGFAWSSYIRYGGVVYAAVAAALLGCLMTLSGRETARG